jgi:hypothetical protein
VASAGSLYVLTDPGKGYRFSPANGLLRPTGLPLTFSPVFALEGADDHFVVHRDGVSSILRLEGDRLKASTAALPLRAFSGWRDGDRLLVAGMRPRRARGESYVKLGSAAVFSVSAASGVAERLRLPNAVPDAVKAVLGEMAPGEFSPRGLKVLKVRLECWLASMKAGSVRWLVGGALIVQPFEDRWGMTVEPDWADHVLLLLFCDDGRQVRLARVLYPYGHVALVRRFDEGLLYLVSHQHRKEEPAGFKVRDLVCLRSGDRFERMEPLMVDGLDPAALVLDFRPRFEDGLGFFATLGTPAGLGRIDSYLLLSDDGRSWKVTLKLAEPPHPSVGAEGMSLREA